MIAGTIRKAGLYRLAFSGDTALDLPEDKAQRETALRVAREQDKWEAITKAGEKPVMFVFDRVASDPLVDWFVTVTGEPNASQLKELFLLALVAVENVDGAKVRRVKHERYDGESADPAILDEVIPRAALFAVIGELGWIVASRELALTPLS